MMIMQINTDSKEKTVCVTLGKWNCSIKNIHALTSAYIAIGDIQDGKKATAEISQICEVMQMPCYKSGGCGAYEMRSCRECPASKPDYLERGKKNMIKPRICDVLGIDVGVPFKVKGYKGKYHINSDGVMKWEEQGSSNAAIYEAINHPEHIVKVISLSEQEVEAIKAIKNLFPNAEYVERIKNSNIVGIGNSENGWIADINNALFPSLKPGNSIDIDDALAM